MFIDIENAESVLKLSSELIKYANGREKISPDICVDFLMRTNHGGVVKKMLGCIANLPKSEQAKFKEVVFSVFDKRMQPLSVEKVAKEIARVGGYEDKLEQVIEKVKKPKQEIFVLASKDVKELVVLLSGDDYKNVKFYKKYHDADRVLFLNEYIDFKECDFGNIKKFDFKDGASIRLDECEGVSDDIEFSKCHMVWLTYLSLKKVKNLKFREAAAVNLFNCKDIEGNIDLSRCSFVYLSHLNLEKFEKMKFKDDAYVCIECCENLSSDIDCSRCNKVVFSNIDFKDFKVLKVGDNVKVSIKDCKNEPVIMREGNGDNSKKMGILDKMIGEGRC